MKTEEIEEIKKVSEAVMKENPSWRKGQTLWNVTESFVYKRGDAQMQNNFEELRASSKDCFYQDERCELFLEALLNV